MCSYFLFKNCSLQSQLFRSSFCLFVGYYIEREVYYKDHTHHFHEQLKLKAIKKKQVLQLSQVNKAPMLTGIALWLIIRESAKENNKSPQCFLTLNLKDMRNYREAREHTIKYTLRKFLYSFFQLTPGMYLTQRYQKSLVIIINFTLKAKLGKSEC